MHFPIHFVDFSFGCRYASIDSRQNLGFAHYLDEAKTVLEQSKAVEKVRSAFSLFITDI